jgi:trk system potassium uptake protein TrkH
MGLAGVNFVLHYRTATGRLGSALRDAELRYFAILLAGATLVVYWTLAQSGSETELRTAAFQVVSIATTTGYATADFEGWPALALLALLQLMILGGMAGSTSGGVKSLRVVLGVRALANVIDRLGHRSAVVHPVRYDGKPVGEDVLAGVWAFLTAYFLLVIAVTLLVAASGYDVETSVTAALTTVGNVGPGLGAIGPSDNFSHFPGFVKIALCVTMIAGRLELFTLLVLFHRDFWRR